MPVNRDIELNGFEFTLTTFSVDPQVVIDIGAGNIVQAIKDRNPDFLSALEQLVEDYDEIKSVLFAEESLGMWFQSSYANNKNAELHRILHSKYASDKLKQYVRQELGYITPPTRNVSPTEWFAMMYGVYQAMADEEKQELHKWEQEYVDGSGKFATSDWPGWERYIGKFPSAPSEAVRNKRRGHIYLVRANTGEYKIGYSVDVKNRIKAFSVQPPFEYKLLYTFPTDDMVQAEALLHERFSEKRIKGEWFALSVDDVDYISQLIGYENEQFLSSKVQR